jgi:hypothetical protein
MALALRPKERERPVKPTRCESRLVATLPPKPPRIRQALHRGRMVLRVNTLVEAVILHPGVFAGFRERHRAVSAAYRAAEGLCPVVHVAQLANMQPGIAPADITPDPQWPEDLAKRSEAIGYATEGTDHAARLEPRCGE